MLRRLVVGMALASLPVVLAAQLPSRNVNMVSGRTLPEGDPFLQRQNEPSVAASTRNPLHLLAGSNDYRTVDLPGLQGGETGDAWMGLFKSFDGGSTWRSTLLPGYPQDTSAEGAASPLKGYQAAADPVVRAGTNGLFYYSGIVFDRSEAGKNGLFVARFIDNNNKEAGDPIVYLGASLVASSPGPEFIDKPWLAVDIPRSTAQTCTFTTTQSDPIPSNPGRTRTVTQSFPGGAAYVVYSVISVDGDTVRSQIYLTRSLDCGLTWSAGQRLSSLDDPINQGATLAIDPRDGGLYVAWRRFSADGTDDAILVTRSIDQGRKWDPPGRARRFPRGRKLGLDFQVHGRKFKPPSELTDLSSLDQPTTTDRFRTNAYPTMTVDDTGRVYVAWAERGFAMINTDPDDGDARVLLASSSNGQSWTTPVAVDNGLVAGHQIMPALSFAGGKLMIAYYDFREDVSGVFRKWIDEQSALFYGGKRHTVDVRAVMATPGVFPVFGPSVRVSEYLWGSRPGTGPRPVEQLQFNPPNLPIFKLGTVPFLGDYIDLAPSPAFVPVAGGWAYNTAPSSSPLFHAVWTDNRDIVPPADGNWVNYTPPGMPAGPSLADPSVMRNACIPGQEGMRNQNIYTARITGGLVAGSPGNAKPLDPLVQRTFVIYAQNTTTSIRTFRLRIENQPVGGRASFSQFPLPPYTAESEPPVTVLDVMVAPRSTIARNLFATSTDPHAQILVSVREAGEVGGAILEAGLETTIVLNPDIANPDIANPDIANPDIANPDIANAEVHNPDIANPDIANPDISNPDIANPDIANPDIANPDIANVQVANPDIANPDIANPDIANPDIANPDIANPDIANPDIANQSLTDTTWTITNDGNTTSAFTIKLLLTDPNFTLDPSLVVVQLVLRKVYTTPVAINCELALHGHNVLLANIVHPQFTTVADLANPDIANPDIANPDIANATLWLAPGEEAKITLRTLDKNIHDDYTFVPAEQVIPVAVAQAVNTEDLTSANPLPPIAVPDMLVAHFVDLPLTAVAGEPYGPVRVRVTDAHGAVMPGANVQLELFQLPNTTTPLYILNTATAVTGLAQFSTPSFQAPGTYRFRATAQMVGYPPAPVWSAEVVVEPGADPNQHNVTNADDAGAGSLRQAILDANASEGPDEIRFAIPGAGAHVILLTSPLPPITGPTFVNGTSQGGGPAPAIILDGSNAGATANGLALTGADITIRGLSIVRFGGPAISIASTAAGAVVEANYLGLLPTGTAAANATGIQSDAPSYRIGGASIAERNVISGNSGWGLLLQGEGTMAARRVIGNYIGTDPTGTESRSNNGGLWVNSTITIGGAAAGEGNLISGNGTAGIAVLNDDNAVTVQGNIIGLNAAGTAAIPNTGPGVSINDAEFSVIGGTTAGARNVISGNSGPGIQLVNDASVTTIQGNYIGVNAAGTAAIGNAGPGILVQATFSTQIGGGSAAARNVISGNSVDGIRLADGVNNVIVGNYIGLDAAGDADLGNTQAGVRLTGESYNNRIGNGGVGNVISGNNAHGVVIENGSNENNVFSNLIGTDATGVLRRYNGFLNEFLDIQGAGVLVQGHDNRIGQPGEGNVISGNGTGVSVAGGASGNIVQANLVGLTTAGSAALGNRFGIFVSGADTLIGGETAGEGNVVSGNTVEGIAVTGETASNVRIQGNLVGTSANGQQAIGNQFAGIRVGFGAPGVLIGGDGGAGNLISGNNNSGLDLSSVGTIVQGNRIGTSASMTPLGNAIHGIRITGTNSSVEGNVIAFNTAAGISFTGSGNAVVENSIYDNGGLGIDGHGEGVTPNDVPEADGLQNFPVLSSVATSGANTQIVGSLTSTASTLFEIVFYLNQACDPSGHGEGRSGFATGQFATNGSGVATINIGYNIGLPPGQFVTATARNLTTGDTSEFSACVIVTASGPNP
jgi:hypothetical protein